MSDLKAHVEATHIIMAFFVYVLIFCTSIHLRRHSMWQKRGQDGGSLSPLEWN